MEEVEDVTSTKEKFMSAARLLSIKETGAKLLEASKIQTSNNRSALRNSFLRNLLSFRDPKFTYNWTAKKRERITLTHYSTFIALCDNEFRELFISCFIMERVQGNYIDALKGKDGFIAWIHNSIRYLDKSFILFHREEVRNNILEIISVMLRVGCSLFVMSNL